MVLIDAPAATHDATRAFWGGVTGTEPDVGESGTYANVGTLGGGIKLETQRLGSNDDTARVHLDVEADDVDAEVARLVGLGATVLERTDDWVVLRDPAGLLFCVVPVWTDGFADHAVTWP